MDEIYIYGASGHGKVVLDIAVRLGFKISGFIDDNPILETFESYKVFKSLPKGGKYVIAIGDNTIREKIASQCPNNIIVALVHDTAIIASNVHIATGTIVAASAVVNASSTIKCNSIINTGAIVEHDCIIEDFVHISPNATICGGVTVGRGTHIGAGAVVIPGVKIGDRCTIGAGTVVLKDVANGVTMVGNPGRVIKK
ncbi:acetyltransferase [uncultured Nonlabens sp.]|uniref:acetyltransferase n=1 Tax=uncultured Nonlabens sp. TaxID=859306 RepID=UPI00261A42CF|nr:acetyltransferase [uncultured Nonlabens sp.]